MKLRILLSIAALLAVTQARLLHAQSYNFQIVEECEGNAPLPMAINNSGYIVGEAHSLNSTYSLGFLYTPGSCKTYSLDSQGTSFLGITDANQIIGFLPAGQNYIEQAGSFTGLPPYPNAARTYFCCLDQAGVMAGNYYPTGGEAYGTGFLYQNGKWSSLPIPSVAGSYPVYGLSAKGIAVGTFFGDYLSGFTFKEGKITYFQYPGAKYTTFNGINENDIIVGTYVLEGSNDDGIFLYNLQTETWTDLKFVYPYNDIMPVGINNSGVIAAEYTPSGGLLIATPNK